MARQIKLTRDERIALNEAIDSDGQFDMLDSEISAFKVEQLVVKLQHRGLLNGMRITDEGRRAMAEARQTKPKGNG